MIDSPAISPYLPTWYALRPFAGEIVLTLTIAALLLLPFFSPRQSNRPCGLVALLGTVIAFLSELHNASSGEAFNGMLISDGPAIYFKAILYLFTAGVVLMWFAATFSSMREGDGAEFFVLLIGAALGMSLMASTDNLLMIFLSIELASLPSYVLAGFRKTQRTGAEASLKYVLFGAACSAIMIFGLSYLYGLSGSLQFSDILSHIHNGGAEAIIVGVALICVLAGIGFKIALVPLHFWCPDVFEGAGVDVAAFLSVASKGAALVLLARLIEGMRGMNSLGSEASSPQGIAVIIGILGALTATVANVAALGQTNVKRLLAYSSIAHAGYMLCVLPLLLISKPEPAMQALLVYLTVYLFMNLGAFMVAGIVERQDGSNDLANYAGLGKRAAGLAICMTLFLFSLIGLPPLAGFIAKLNIMWLLGSASGAWWALVAIIAANTVGSVYYYAKVIRAMYFEESDAAKIFPNPLAIGIASICAVTLLAMLLFFAPISHLIAGFAPK